jgi:tRNA C32,U32 (ribose-2'-O)-methylase TrmJ
MGCGTIGCIGLVLIVGFGIWMSRGGATKLIDYYFRIVEREVDRNSDPEVTSEQRQALKEELQRFRANVQDHNAAEAQPILLELNRAVRDQRLSVEEVESLTRRLREINERLEKKPASTTVTSLRVPRFALGES